MANARFIPNKNFGKVSTSKANTANQNIKRIAESSKSDDQKAREISAEFQKAYAATGFDMSQVVDTKYVKRMLKKGQIPEVTDKAPTW